MAAVNLAAAPTAINNPMANPYTAFNPHTQQPTPVSSANATPTTASPTSPRTVASSPTHQFPFSRQLYPPKAPLYTPAVLRPTERPARHSYTKSSSSNSVAAVIANAGPLTPPSSADNSYSSKDGESLVEESLQRRLLASDGITRVVTDEWNDETLEDVTGQPTRDHWKPDSSSPTCDFPPCPISFTLLRRRHHCRRCGNIFCSDHSLYEVPLDQHARFHPQGVKARACDSCWGDFVAWRRRRSARESCTSEGSGSGISTPVGDGNDNGNKAVGAVKKAAKDKGRDAPVIGSVPRDWNWSTF